MRVLPTPAHSRRVAPTLMRERRRLFVVTMVSPGRERAARALSPRRCRDAPPSGGET